MYYISSQKGNKYGVTDTEDGIEEFYTKEQLMSIYAQGIEVNGLSDENIFVVYPIDKIRSLINSGDFKEAYKYLPEGYRLVTVLRSSPVGELNICSRECIEVSRNYRGNYNIEVHRNYYTDCDFNTLVDKVSWYFINYKLIEVRIK